MQIFAVAACTTAVLPCDRVQPSGHRCLERCVVKSQVPLVAGDDDGDGGEDGGGGQLRQPSSRQRRARLCRRSRVEYVDSLRLLAYGIL
eukprot:5809412-Pleurochrysis_carterae.AAC.2